MFGNKLERYKRSFEEGEVIFEEDDWGQSVYIIESGTVEVVKKSGRHTRRIATIEENQLVGEMILTNNPPKRAATIRALTAVTGWKISTEQFESLITKNEEMRKKLISTLTNRLSNATKQLADTQQIETLILDLSFILIPLLDRDEWQDSGPQTDLKIEYSPEFLAYHFDTSLEIMNKFLSLKNDFRLDRFDEETKENIFKIGRRIAKEGMKKIRTQLTQTESGKEDLVRIARTSRDHLETLLEKGQAIRKGKFREIITDYKEMRETAEDKFSDYSGYLPGLVDEKLGKIGSEIDRLRHKVL